MTGDNAQSSDGTEHLSVEDVVDHEDNCAACGVHDRVEDSRYCAGCRDALVRADGGQVEDGVEQPAWEVGIEAWGPDDEPGAARWHHYHVHAPDRESVKTEAVEQAQKPGIDAIIGVRDDYEVFEVAGPFEDDDCTVSPAIDRSDSAQE